MKINFNVTVRESPIGNIDVDYSVDATGDELANVIERLVKAYPKMMAELAQHIQEAI